LMSTGRSPALCPKPHWFLKDAGSFSSVHVRLPPNTSINCESDAVVTFSGDVEVRGVMSGGILGALGRTFLTKESFFSTSVENRNHASTAEVMMAPSEPGGIALHKLIESALLLTSGSYIASDVNVKISSGIQKEIRNSLFSGTGFFLLRASGTGYIALGGYGSVHNYNLGPGEIRSVDNGHLIAWSASMRYWVGLASSSNNRGINNFGTRLINSMTSGEGLMCHFEGPGVIYIQSHKPRLDSSGSKQQQAPPNVGVCIILMIVCVFFLGIFFFSFAAKYNTPYQSDYDYYGNRHQENYGNGYGRNGISYK